MRVNKGIGCGIVGLGTIWGVAGIGWLVAQVVVVVWVVEFVVVGRLFWLKRPVLTKWVKYFLCGFWKGIAMGFSWFFQRCFGIDPEQMEELFQFELLFGGHEAPG